MDKGIQITSKDMEKVIDNLNINNRYKKDNVAIYTKNGDTQIKVVDNDEKLKIIAYNKAKKFIKQVSMV